jgi:stage V sporulation protein B
MNKNFLKAMFCVTFFSVATRALGFLLKIYLSRNLGSVMLGSYQVAMSIFAVMMTFVSSGIPVVLSRNVSYFAGNNDKKSIGSIVSSGLIITGIICMIVSLVVLLFPNFLSLIFTSNASTEMIYILLPALIFSSIYEVLRGALWGRKKFFAISITEFIEQVLRIILLFILFNTTFLNISPTNKTALSLSLACTISAIIVIIIYFKSSGNLANPKYEFKNLLKESSPITAVRTVSSIVSSIIAIIIPLRLQTFGYSSTEALSEFGIIMGMTFPLLMIPATLIGSLAVTMIPSISEQSNNIDSGNIKNKSIIKSKINFSIKSSLLFSSILLSTFISLGVPICKLIFGNEKAGIYLSYASIIMIPLGLSQITSSILNAIGLEMKSLKNYILSSSVLILCIFFLPKYFGTFALIIGYFLMSLISAIMNVSMLMKRNLVSLGFLKTILMLLITNLISACLGIFIYNLLQFNLLLNIIISAIFTLGSNLLLIICFNIANVKIIFFKQHKKFA